MVKDIEGNRIEIQEGEKFHEKAIGKSGSGKTYWACNRVEEYARIMPVVILDFSYTYTEDQTEKNGVWRASSITRFNLKNKNFKFIIDDADACEMVTDSLIASLDIKAMMQKRIIRQACKISFSRMGFFSFAVLFKILDFLARESEDGDYIKNVNFLMARMYHLRNVDTLHIVVGEEKHSAAVYIIEVSDFSSQISDSLAQFILEVMWRRIRKGRHQRIQVVLDEFQNLRLTGSAIEEMLREGRKFGLGLTLMSQYINPTWKDALEQAAIGLYFQPNENNLLKTAKCLSPSEPQKWMQLLGNLKRGEFVLDGVYKINGQEKRISRKIVCHVEKDEKA